MAFASNPVVVNSGGDMLPEMIHSLLEANSQTFKKGQLVYSNAGAITAVDSTSIAAAVVLGVAQKDATNVTSGNIAIPVQLIKPSDIVRMHISSSGTAALSSNCTVGKAYGLDVTSNVCTVNYSDPTYATVVFVGHCLDAAAGYTYEGLFRFLPASCQIQTGN